jgi:DHA1 family tetracycline resistance protein-like MFS transporter
MFVFAGMQFLCAPLIGNLSDRFGRRPVLIVSLLAIGIDYAITGFAPTIVWLFVARFLSGIAGASYSVANAYIADVTPPEKRAQNFGLVGAAFGLGFIAGPAVGGILGQYGSRVPFFVAAGIAVVNAAFGFFVMRESLAPANRRTFDIRRGNPVGALAALRRYPAVLGFCVVFVLIRLSHDSLPALWTYYTILKFQWSPAEVGYSLMAVGAMTTLVFGGLTRVIVPRLGETRAVYLGLACGATGFLGYAMATQSWMMFPAMLAWSLNGLAGPSLNALMSVRVGPTEQGELQGALASLGGLTSIFAPPLLASLFAYFTAPAAPVYFPGAGFAAASVCLIAAVTLFARIQATPAAAAAVDRASV